MVNLALSINQLMEEEVLAQVNKEDTLRLTQQHQYYNDTTGIRKLRESVANFLTRHHKPDEAIKPQNVSFVSPFISVLSAF